MTSDLLYVVALAQLMPSPQPTVAHELKNIIVRVKVANFKLPC